MERDSRFGAAVGPYDLQERIGQGGMGVVYRARERATGEVVAIKVMLEALSLDPLFRERFVREAELVPTIQHQNIVPIRGWGQLESALYLVMDLVEGPDLKKVLRENGPLGLRRTKTLIAQIASALDAAHESGIVHRDVKAQNILLDQTGDEERALLTDFGLMKPVASETSISRTGQIFGSVPYMAPELIEEMPSDGRADVYALGCVLYECLTGSVPFTRSNEVAMLWAHIHEEPPRPSLAATGIPGGVDDVVVKALQKHPDDRYLTCGELYADLVEGMRRKKSVTYGRKTRLLVPRVRRRLGPRDLWAPNFFPELARVERARRSIDWRKAALVAVTFSVPLASIAHVASPDGLPRAVADAASAGSALVSRVFDAKPTRDEKPQLARRFRRSDATTASSTQPKPLDVAGARLNKSAERPAPVSKVDRSAADEPNAPQVVAAPTGGSTAQGRIVFTRVVGGAHEIFSIKPDGTGEKNLTNHPAGDSLPAISPDGRWIAFWSNRAQWQAELFVMRSDGTRVRRVTRDNVYDSHPAWSPDGRSIVYTSYPTSSCDAPACVPGTEAEGDIRVINIDGTGQRTLVSTRDNYAPDWSPDGKRIVFLRDDDIYTMELDGSGFRRLTSTPSTEREPQWSPDGRQIVYANLGAVHVIDAYGSSTRQVTPLGEGADSPDWSPNGKQLVYSRCATPNTCDRRHLWIVGLNGAETFRLSPLSGNDFFSDWGREG